MNGTAPISTGLLGAVFVTMLVSASVGWAQSSPQDFARGLKAYEAGQLNRARNLFDSARRQRGSSFMAHLYFGLAVSKQDPKDAAGLSAFERAAELAPNNPRCLFHLGVAHIHAENFVSAEKQLRAAVSIRPDLRDAQFWIALAVRGQGRREDAIEELYHARQLDPKRDEIYIALAELFEELNKLSDAEWALRERDRAVGTELAKPYQVVELFERHGLDERAAAELQRIGTDHPQPPARRLFRKGLEAAGAGDLNGALAAFAEARELAPRWFLPWLHWGIRAQEGATKIKSLERAVQLAPRNAAARHHLGVGYLYGDRFAEAETTLRQALKLSPVVPTTQYQLAMSIRKQGRGADAIAALEKARDQEPNKPEIWTALAELYEAHGKLAEAEQAGLELARLEGPDRAEPYRLVELLERLGRTKKAAQHAAKIARRHPQSSPRPRQVFDRGRLAFEAGELKRARELFGEARAHAPDWFFPHLYWAIVESQLNPDQNRVLAALAHALKLAPHNPRTHYQLGVAHKKAGHLPEAETALRRAVEMQPDLLDARFQLAVTIRERGRADEAIVELERARETTPQHLATLAILAEHYESENRYDDAEDALRAIADLNPSIPYHRYRLAEFLERIGEHRKARRVRRQLNRTAPRTKRNMRPLR